MDGLIATSYGMCIDYRTSWWRLLVSRVVASVVERGTERNFCRIFVVDLFVFAYFYTGFSSAEWLLTGNWNCRGWIFNLDMVNRAFAFLCGVSSRIRVIELIWAKRTPLLITSVVANAKNRQKERRYERENWKTVVLWLIFGGIMSGILCLSTVWVWPGYLFSSDQVLI